jgi:hypothetical protein
MRLIGIPLPAGGGFNGSYLEYGGGGSGSEDFESWGNDFSFESVYEAGSGRWKSVSESADSALGTLEGFRSYQKGPAIKLNK